MTSVSFLPLFLQIIHQRKLGSEEIVEIRYRDLFEDEIEFPNSFSQLPSFAERNFPRDLAATECHPSPVTAAISFTECPARGQVRVSGKIPGRDADDILRISGAHDDSDSSNSSLA
ncbi:hypothetical protein CEXT_204851 [Caerostris extrusa]|uniref:Uncharacterized protein n=1 Tax=Caerostris extrusa TaxID=172846 RepID=A0AAV4VMC1_CAEEX|nr:hypothetical protein CEXT_204851 [Caerostris extrusa]